MRDIDGMTDFATRRRMMVDTQIRTADVTKFPIIEAILRTPREDFAPASQSEAAYVGENLPLGKSRVILEPRTFAKMLDAMELTGNELVLDIGCGYGYSAAILAHMAAAVVAVEENSAMLADAQEAFQSHDFGNIITHEGPLAEGAPQHGPYDVIFAQGGVAHIPTTITDQLKTGGRMIALFMEGDLGVVRIGTKSSHGLDWRYAFNASAPVLPGFEREQDFVFQ